MASKCLQAQSSSVFLLHGLIYLLLSYGPSPLVWVGESGFVEQLGLQVHVCLQSGGEMSEGVKSSLVLGQSGKKEPVGAGEVEYKQVSHNQDFVGELSDEQKEAEFNRQHEEYIKMKLNRKQELMRIKREEFGTSSSDENGHSSEEEIGEMKQPKKVESKRSRGKEAKGSLQQEVSAYPVMLELKKLTIETELLLLEKEFQVNKRTLPYSKLVRINLFAAEEEGKLKRKIRILMVDEELSLTYMSKEGFGPKDKSDEIFVEMVRAKLQSKEIKWQPAERKTPVQDYSLEQREGAVVFDRILKKSQIIGTWEERYVIIKPEGLYSYRILKSKPTMFISLKEIKEVQTQFEIYKELLVIKLIYNNTKTDFGLQMDPQLQWVTHFAGLIAQ